MGRRDCRGAISYLWRSGADEVAKLRGDAESLIPHRSLLRHRIPAAIGTDNKPADPWLAFRAVVDRRDMTSGAMLGERERLTRIQALRALTIAGAWLTFNERDLGILAPGDLADLTALDRDPLSAPLDDLPALSCRLTMVGGRIVHAERGI